MLYILILKIQHDCPFSRFSKNNPKVEILHWCNSQKDVLELRGEKPHIESAINDVESELGMILAKFPEHNQTQLIIKRCIGGTLPLAKISEKFGSIELPPIKYFAGSEIVRLLVTAEDAGLILDDLRKMNPSSKVNVLKLAPMKDMDSPKSILLPLDELKEQFTVKQLTAITNAYNKGYYDLPRSILIEKLAEEMNIHRRTFEEHLRKAEKKVMSFLIPTMNFYS
ncbi:MAG: helix-turn-helix domain-containing protein [Candidatus Hodarchaeota archaeon]